MKHLILTRFNIGSINYCLDESWLKHRIELFRRYCLPSVREQTNQNFEWCLFVHPETPDWLKRILTQLTAEYKNLKQIFAPLRDCAIRQTAELAQEEGLPFVTTRLDNDDILFPHFVELVQKCVSSERAVLVFPRGFSFLPSGSIVWKRHKEYNQFISLVEIALPAETVYYRNCKAVSRLNPTRVVSQEPMWAHVLHKENISPRKFRGYMKRHKPASLVPELVGFLGSGIQNS